MQLENTPEYTLVQYVDGWPISVYFSAKESADDMGCHVRTVYYYTTQIAHERADRRRRNDGTLIMKIKLDEWMNDGD